ncbi:neuropeptide receptor 15-like [Octopus vulgaris]|nr:neuropeptide receptor 15-like [Octopus vulgaris]
MFFIIGATGFFGNLLVIYSVISDRKMRSSVTNLLITNLALADLSTLISGVPDIVLFILNRGWLLGEIPCKLHRFAMVTSLYVSVLSLCAVCIERYIGIIHPFEAHIVCNRRRIICVICIVWFISLVTGLPPLLFNTVMHDKSKDSVGFCRMRFPTNSFLYFMIYKFGEFFLYYFAPLLLQMVLYCIITKQLFLGSEHLHRPVVMTWTETGNRTERSSDALQARKGVVKMLIISVLVYFISYSPIEIMLFYKMISPHAFKDHWSYHVIAIVIAYVNSSANPILYSIFSQNFRRRFNAILCGHEEKNRHMTATSTNSRMWRLTSLRSATTEV